MRQGSLIGIRMLIGLALVLLWAGCDTFTYVPLKSKAVIPSEATAPPAPAPGEQGAAPGTPQPKPTLDQQVQALEARVQQLEGRLAELERPQPPAVQPDKVGPLRLYDLHPRDVALEPFSRMDHGRNLALGIAQTAPRE